MTKKDYIKAAGIVLEYKRGLGSAPKHATAIAHAFADLFRGDNPRFDRGRFFEACEVKDMNP